MATKDIKCTEIEVIERGRLQVECPYCNEVFVALASAFMPEDYRCPKCNKSMEIRFIAASKESAALQLRPEVQWFAQQMEEVLKANDHKTGWKNCSPLFLLSRLIEEVGELIEICCKPARDGWMLKEMLNHAASLVRESTITGDVDRGYYNPQLTIKESSDVANFAMMIADNANALFHLAQPKAAAEKEELR